MDHLLETTKSFNNRMKEEIIKFLKHHKQYFEDKTILGDIIVLLCGSYSMMFNFRGIVLDALASHNDFFNKIGGVHVLCNCC